MNFFSFLFLVLLFSCTDGVDGNSKAPKNVSHGSNGNSLDLSTKASQVKNNPQSNHSQGFSGDCVSIPESKLKEIKEIDELNKSVIYENVASVIQRNKYYRRVKRPIVSSDHQHLDRIDKICREHLSDKYESLSVLCVDNPTDSKAAIERTTGVCKEIIYATDKLHRDEINMWREKSLGYLEFLKLVDIQVKKYNTLGKSLKSVNKLKVNVHSSNLEYYINSKSLTMRDSFLGLWGIVTLGVLDNISKKYVAEKRIIDSRAYNYFWAENLKNFQFPELQGIDDFYYVYESSYIQRDVYKNAVEMVCDLRYDREYESVFRLTNNYDSFISDRLYFHPNDHSVTLDDFVSGYDIKGCTGLVSFFPSSKEIGCYKIKSSSSKILKKPERSFEITCLSKTPEQMTVENLNKTLKGIIEVEVIE